MNSLPIKCKDAATTFLLARRAERLARPLVDMTDGAWRFSITVTLGDQVYPEPWHISVYAHYVEGAATIPNQSNMPVYATGIATSERLAQVIERIRGLAAEQVQANREAERRCSCCHGHSND
ncbi:hypothetical protein [Glutamicibacter sp. X7]